MHFIWACKYIKDSSFSFTHNISGEGRHKPSSTRQYTIFPPYRTHKVYGTIKDQGHKGTIL